MSSKYEQLSFLYFREIVEKNPSPQAFVMLGDAYMSIQEVKKKK